MATGEKRPLVQASDVEPQQCLECWPVLQLHWPVVRRIRVGREARLPELCSAGSWNDSHRSLLKIRQYLFPHLRIALSLPRVTIFPGNILFFDTFVLENTYFIYLWIWVNATGWTAPFHCFQDLTSMCQVLHFSWVCYILKGLVFFCGYDICPYLSAGKWRRI